MMSDTVWALASSASIALRCASSLASRACKSTYCALRSLPEMCSVCTVPIFARASMVASNFAAGTMKVMTPVRIWSLVTGFDWASVPDTYPCSSSTRERTAPKLESNEPDFTLIASCACRITWGPWTGGTTLLIGFVAVPPAAWSGAPLAGTAPPARSTGVGAVVGPRHRRSDAAARDGAARGTAARCGRDEDPDEERADDEEPFHATASRFDEDQTRPRGLGNIPTRAPGPQPRHRRRRAPGFVRRELHRGRRRQGRARRSQRGGQD